MDDAEWRDHLDHEVGRGDQRQESIQLRRFPPSLPAKQNVCQLHRSLVDHDQPSCPHLKGAVGNTQFPTTAAQQPPPFAPRNGRPLNHLEGFIPTWLKLPQGVPGPASASGLQGQVGTACGCQPPGNALAEQHFQRRYDIDPLTL